ncbi:hypothetical protein BJ508DRAFT_382021 [Ascobolus immersus RN42]|uniref:Uncharacterized protein n=1 Tax=Ascobolus immersus RN42 TaxID=1160509 RepID=A0A3N4HA86_ASCIM|nr:hypothetical protein BJ508DRAFT_382021 [Ascobolus immersus RN42]
MPSLLSTFVRYLEKLAPSEYQELLDISETTLRNAAINLGNIVARAKEFPKLANEIRDTNGILPLEAVLDGFLDVLSTKITRLDLFTNWLKAKETASRLKAKDYMVDWFEEMEDCFDYSKERLLSAVEFWANSATVSEEFEFLYDGLLPGDGV